MDISIAKTEETIIAYLILVILGTHIYLTNKKSVLKNRVLEYLGTVHIYYISYLITIIRRIILSDELKIIFYLSEILKFVSIIGMACFTFITIQYLLHTKLFSTFITECITMVPLAISILLYITTPFTHLLICLDKNDNYIRGPLYFMPYLLVVFYYLIVIILILKCVFNNVEKSEKKFALMLSQFIISPMTAQVISYVIKMPLLEISIALTFLIFYLDFIKRNISIDGLTGLNNRRFLQSDLFSLMRRSNRNKLVMLMIDANEFKKINDNYGHLEGDAALKRISQALEQCTYFLRNCTIARYGGDEFIVCFIERQKNDGKLIAYNIIKTLEKLNEEDNAKSTVTVSIGIAKFSDKFSLPEDFIKEADKELYKVKKEKNQWQM